MTTACLDLNITVINRSAWDTRLLPLTLIFRKHCPALLQTCRTQLHFALTMLTIEAATL